MYQLALQQILKRGMPRCHAVLAAVFLVALWACEVHAGPDIDLTKSGPGAVERISDVDSFEVRCHSGCLLSLRSKNVLEGKMSSVLTCALFKL